MIAFLYWGSTNVTFSNVTMLQAPWLRNQGSIPDTGLLQSIENGYEAHLASYSMIPRDSFPGDKASGASSWPLNLCSPTCLHVMALIKHGANHLLFRVYLTMLSVSLTLQDNYWIMNWIECGRKWLWPNLRFSHGCVWVCVKGLRKSINNSVQLLWLQIEKEQQTAVWRMVKRLWMVRIWQEKVMIYLTKQATQLRK